jgi:SH3-like domain-containing protein
MKRVALARLVFSGAFTALAASASAQDAEVPYWASLAAEKVNMRVGPARDYQISWIYHRDNLPLKVVRLHEGWRLVEDPDGARGWMLARFLSRERTAIVRVPVTDMVDRPGTGRVLWRLERGVVGQLGKCEANWCRFEVHGRAGYVAADALWGDGEP